VLFKVVLNKCCYYILFFFVYANAECNKICVVSIPKSGTFLIARYIEELTGKSWSMIGNITEKNLAYWDWNKKFAVTHSYCMPEAIDFCKNNNVKVIFNYRDPRDIVISAYFYLKDHEFAKAFTSSQLIDELIINHMRFWWISNFDEEFRKLNIKNYFPLFLEWIKQDFVCSTCFECLVGPQGGGAVDMQTQEITKIAKFLDITVKNRKLNHILHTIFGNTVTFRQGKIGSWRKHFSPAHKQLFKNLAGQILIELKYENDLDW